MVVFAIDFDGTIMKETVEVVNELFDLRDTHIVVYTARNESMRENTEKALKKLGVKYHSLVMEKTRADYYVDDRSLSMEEIKEVLKAKMGLKTTSWEDCVEVSYHANNSK